MAEDLKIELSKDKKRKEDFLRVQVSGKNKRVRANVTLVRYRDKDTRQLIAFVPSLDITAYGSTPKKVKEMLEFSLNEFCRFITNLPHKRIASELSKLGWKHNELKKKEFSKTFIDEDGELKNFNAVGDEVEILQLAM